MIQVKFMSKRSLEDLETEVNAELKQMSEDWHKVINCRVEYNVSKETYICVVAYRPWIGEKVAKGTHDGGQ